MNFHVINENIIVDFLKVDVASTSSMILIGDTKTIQLSSALDVSVEGAVPPPTPLVSTAPKG